jgi:hypothetical protein
MAAIEEGNVKPLHGLRVVLKLEQQVAEPRRKDTVKPLLRVLDRPHSCLLLQSLPPRVFAPPMLLQLHLPHDRHAQLGRALRLALTPRVAAQPVVVVVHDWNSPVG